MKLNKIVSASALAAALAATILSPLPAAASVSLTGSCVDGGGRTWRSKVVWGSEYTDSAGVRRVRVDFAGWTTNGRSVPTDSTVRTYDRTGKRLQQLKRTERIDYHAGTTWRSRNPLNPPSAPGKARVTVKLGRDGDGKRDCTRTFVQPVVARPAAPTGSVGAAAPGWWSADLTGVPVGSMGCRSGAGTTTAAALEKQWDYWDNCGGAVVSPATERIATPPGSTGPVVRWRKAAGDPNVYQKLNRTFTKDNWPAGGTNKAKSASPADVSARYEAYLYIPSSDFLLNPGHGWAQLLQLKENYTDANGQFHQDPLWGLGVNNFSGTVRGGLFPHDARTFVLSSYMDRWVRWEFRLYQGAKDTTGHGGRIELWADGTLIETGYESERHVGSAALAPLSRTQGWVWIAGPYSSNQTTKGVPDYRGTHVTTYVGPSRIMPLS